MANILIVDDDTAVQITIRLLLERAGHHATVAGDGRTGLALFEASHAGKPESRDVSTGSR